MSTVLIFYRGKMRSFILAVFTAFVTAERKMTSIICPIPGNPPPSTVTAWKCAQYTACEYSNGVCHMKNNEEAGYIVSSHPVITGRGFMVNLEKADPSATLFKGDIQTLIFEVVLHEVHHVEFKVYDPARVRYEIPVPLNLPETHDDKRMYKIEVSRKGSPFAITVKRKSNNNTLFRSVGPMTYENQFIQITTSLASSYLYGIGESNHASLKRTFRPRVTYPIFARDQPTDPGSIVNEYGIHPYYVNVEDDEGNTHSVLFYNSNAMEYSLFVLEDETPAVTIRTIGGVLDFHMFFGPTPEDVNKQYYSCIGLPLFPPYWSLGFHLSRHGYNSMENYTVVHDRMIAAGIPWDTQFFDIDYMNENLDFTYDHERFAGFPELIHQLHDENMKVVLILDTALAANFETYDPSIRGRNADVFVKWISPELTPEDQPEGERDYIVGKVWPNDRAVFPDFLKSSTAYWWQHEIRLFRRELHFDGLWIDMNEPANFGTNMGDPWSLQCPETPLDEPPYPTLAADSAYTQSGKLSDKTICMSAIHSDDVWNYTHYDIHNLYGYLETLATYDALSEEIFPRKRHLILSRSTFPGSGEFAFHWLGDNAATWEHLRVSLIGIMEFNMFAIPMVGADVCGFNGEPSEELCIRWMQAGAFYPLDRNHNTIDVADQDPARPGWPRAASISRDVLMLRYQYIPYFYARFHRAHMNGHSVIRPLFNVFPSDLTARDIDDQFMWSEDLMVAPVVTQGAKARHVYFPKSIWYDLVSGTIDGVGPITKEVDAPLHKIPVYVRGGSILPFQEPATTTVQSRKNPFGLTVALDESRSASGEVFWDRDGEQEHVMSETFIGQLNFADNQLTLEPKHDPTAADGLMLETIQFFGYPINPESAKINGQSADASSWTFDETTNVLILKLSVPLNQALTIVFK